MLSQETVTAARRTRYIDLRVSATKADGTQAGLPGSVSLDVLKEFAGGPAAVIRSFLHMARADLDAGGKVVDVGLIVRDADLDEFLSLGLATRDQMTEMVLRWAGADGAGKETVYRMDLLKDPDFAKVLGC